MINNSILKQFNINMKDLIPKILESIVAVYGEKHRSTIEDRLNRIYINTYITYEDVKNYYNYSFDHTRDLLSIDFLRELGIEVSADIEDKVYSDGTYYLTDEQKNILKTYFDFSYFSKDSPIYAFGEEPTESLEDFSTKTNLKKRCEVLTKLGHSVTPENYYAFVETDEGKQAISDIEKVYDIAIKYREILTRFEAEHQDIKEYIDQCNSLKQELSFKYTRKFFETILPFLPEDDKKQVSQALTSKVYSEYDLIRKADPDKKYYSESYEEVNPDLDPVLFAQITAIKTSLQIQEDREFFYSTGNYQSCLENLSSLGLLSDDDFNIDFIKQKVICVSPNAVIDENGNVSNFNIIHLPILGMLRQYRDVLAIHEILHVVELSMKQVSDKECQVKTGLDTVKITLSDEPNLSGDGGFSHSIRTYEHLSENLHHQLSIEVTEDLHSKGIYLFDDPRASQVRGSSSYEQMTFITSSFINNFGPNIIDAMIGDDDSSLAGTIGRENLNVLNTLVRDYRALPYYQMMNDVINGRDTELTQKRTALKSEADNLVETMLQHSSKQTKPYIISTQEIEKTTINTGIESKDVARRIVQNDINLELNNELEINK